MPIAKRDIVELLMARSDHERAIRADDELPELVFVEFHGKLLQDLGLDPALLVRDLDEPSRRFARRRPPAHRRRLAGRS